MGFDPECILQPEMVPGEYYCPLCRQLVHPAEVQQTHCGHLFCRPCVIYIVGTTRCCPYENHPINEGDPKNLQETNPAVYEAINRISVRCLFHKSGCLWQGLLSESAAHSASCGYGNSPVYCNRCGVQILHRQVQEHAQTCTGNMPQTQAQPQPQPQPQLQPQAQPQPYVHLQAPQQLVGQQVPVAIAGNGQVVHAGMQGASQFPAGQVQSGSGIQLQRTPGAPDQSQVQPGLQHQGPAAADQGYQHYYHQQYEQYQQYQQYEQYQQQQFQQQVPGAPAQQYIQTPQPYQVQEPVAQPPPAIQQQVHHPMAQTQQLHPQPAHLQHQAHPQQQPFPQQAHPQQPQFQQPHPQQQPYPQQMHPPQQFQPQSHMRPQQPHQQLPSFQPHLQQSHPQPPQVQQSHPQHPFQHQPHSQHPHHPQLQPQVPHAPLQAQHQTVPQHLPVAPPLQQQTWEQPQQPQPMGWAQDGNPNMGQVQVAQEQMHQHSQAQGAHQNTAHWQGKNLPGPPVNSLAQQIQPHGFQQPLLPRPNAHLQPSPQPVRQPVLHTPANQNVVPGQAVSGVAQGHQTPKPGFVSTQNVNGPSRNQPGQLSEKAAGLPLNQQPSSHVQQDTETSQAPPGVDVKDSLKTSGPAASETVDPLPIKPLQKGDGQLDEQNKKPSPEPPVAKGGLALEQKVTPTTENKQQTPPDKKGSEHDIKEEESEAKQESAPLSQLTQSPTKSIQHTQPQSATHQVKQNPPQVLQNSLQPQRNSKHKQQNQNSSSMQQKDSQLQMQQNQIPPQMQQNQNAPSVQWNQSLLQVQHNHNPLQMQQNQNPLQTHQNQIPPLIQQKAPQMLQSLPQLQHQTPQLHQLQPQVPPPNYHQLHYQSPHQLQHQSPKQKKLLEFQGQQMQEPLLPSLPQMAGLPRSQAPSQLQPGVTAFLPVPNPPFQNAPRHLPGEAMFERSQFMNPPLGTYPEQKLPLPGQVGPALQQQSFPQGILKDQPPQWRPSGPGSFPMERQSPSRAQSPLPLSLLGSGPQRGYLDPSIQSFLPPPPQMDAAKQLSLDHSRHLMEQIAAFENETRGGKNTENEKFSGPRSEDPFLPEAQKRVQQRSMFRPEPPLQYPGFRDGSPPRAPLEILSRFPSGSSLDMPPRAPPHPPLGSDMEVGTRPGIPSEVSMGREFLPRSGFTLNVAGGRDFSAEFGVSHRKLGDFAAGHNPLEDMGLRSSFSLDTASHLKYQSDAFRRGMSPDFGPKSGSLSDIGPRRTPPQPPFQLDSDSRPKSHLDMDARPPFHLDGDSRSRFTDMEPRPSFLLDSDSRPKFFSDSDLPRPPFHLDVDSRSRFPLNNERFGLHMDVDRSKFSFEREPRPRFDSDVDSRRSFESRPSLSFEERSRPGFPSRFSGLHSDNMGGHPEDLGLSSDFLGPRGDNPRNRADSISSIRSPGREPASQPSRRDSFSSGWREPFGLPGRFESSHGGPPLHAGPDLGRDTLRFEDPRFKGLDLHPNPLLHEPLNQGRPFHHVGHAHLMGGPGPGFPHSFASHRPPLGFLNGGPFFKPGSFNDEADPSDFGRKRKQIGSSGWCRICRVDCYTVQGLEEHSKSEEHQKKTLDLVMSIKQDSAKKQKHADPPEVPKDSPKSTPEKREKSVKSDDEDEDEDDEDNDDGSESD